MPLSRKDYDELLFIYDKMQEECARHEGWCEDCPYLTEDHTCRMDSVYQTLRNY